MMVHSMGIVLFLFIPLVLFLFLKYPVGILPSFGIAIAIMIAHRFIAVPFMNRFRNKRCLWCGRTSRRRVCQNVQCGSKVIQFEFCTDGCVNRAKRFFDFCSRNAMQLRAGIFIPLLWYVTTMSLDASNVFHFPREWNKFIFQFFIACTVVTISFLYKLGNETDSPKFPFPIHNLFLLGIRNTLQVFRYVGIWWIIISLIFLFKQGRG
jgi:hypothetical protein